ncbi:MAG: putative lipid II flippase FtsW [Pyrinomonadaceae bacterium]
MARKLQIDEWLFAATVGLALFGVVMVYSASAVIAANQNGNQFHYVIRQGIWTMLGLAAMFVAMRIDYRILRDARVVFPLLGITILLLLAVFGFSPTNGAQRWIKLKSFRVQPSELAKLSLVIFLARFLERRAGEEKSFTRTFMPCAGIVSLLVILVVAEPDLGTAMMLAVVWVVMLYTAGASLVHLGLAAAPALLGLAALLLFVPWRLARMVTFLDPWADPQGAGYQVVQSLIAVGSGGVDGLGFTAGRQKMFFLPFAHSDFIFAVIGEELGLLGALTVVGVFGLLMWRGMRAALGAPDRFGMLLGIGIVTGIVAQALFNMSVVLALVPTKGIPLPFISYGGSALVPTLFAAGVLLNISQQAGVGGDTATRQHGDTATQNELLRSRLTSSPRPRVVASPRLG